MFEMEALKLGQYPGYVGRASFGQQRLQAMEMAQPGLSAYIMSYALHLAGPLIEALIHRAIAAIVGRHDMLRSAFVMEDEELRVFVRDYLPLHVPKLDLSPQPPTQRKEAANEALRQLTLRPFDISTAPLFRFQLIKLEECSHVLGMAVHHAICDGQSLNLFRDEFCACYSALAESRPMALAYLPIQFADFADWETVAATDPSIAAPAEAYWRENLADAAPELDLPIDGTRNSTSYALTKDECCTGTIATRELPQQAVHQLIEIARARRATPAAALLSVLAIMLARWARSEDIIIALPVSKRSRPELTNLIGLLIELLPIRIKFEPLASYRSLVDSTRLSLRGAMENNFIPFERIIELTASPRCAGSKPFHQIMFGLDLSDLDKVQNRAGPLLVLEWPDSPEQDSKTDLSFLVKSREDRWEISLRYDNVKFSADTALMLLDWFSEICLNAAAHPDIPYRQLALAPEHTTLAALEKLNETGRLLPKVLSLDKLFEETVRNNPHAPALTLFDEGVSRQKTFDYISLNQAANRLAHYLSGRGIKRGEKVGLNIAAGADFIITVLAVIKCGAAYVPLDSSLPIRRLRAMVEGAGVRFIVSAGQKLSSSVTQGVEIIDILQSQRLITALDSTGNDLILKPDELAYIMFTSGSTGAPKGVAIPQAGVIRLVCNNDFLSISPLDSVGFASSIAFDASTLEIWGALLNGARLLQVPKEVLLSAAELATFIKDQGLTILWLTKGLFDQLASVNPAIFIGLRVLLTGGDVAKNASFNAVLQAAQGTGLTLLNGYGPTENTTFSTVWEAAGPIAGLRPVPIGRPVSNSRAYVLDDDFRPLPAGLCGELYVAGLGLAHGYAGRSDLTAERFLPDPFASEPGQRMYRTGDLARLNADGLIEYMGRADDQVKIRGFRVEPGDVMAVLSQHPCIDQSYVGRLQDREDEISLIAYVVVRSGQSLTVRDTRAYLNENLPEFMVPKLITILPALPLNSNGKVDRAALALHHAEVAERERAFEAPRGVTETILAEIWAQVLKTPQVGRQDDFFNLGGDSILAIRVVARAGDKGLKINPNMLFKQTTIAELAAAVDRETAKSVQAFSSRFMPLAGAQYRVVRLTQPYIESRAKIPSIGTEWVAGWATLAKPIDAITFGLALGNLRRRHDALRLRLAGDTSMRVLEQMDVPPPVPVSLHRLDSSLPREGFDAARAAIPQALSQGLDPRAGIVFRGALIQSDQDGQQLLLLAHRLAADEISLSILLDELGQELEEGSDRIRERHSPPLFGSWLEKLTAYSSRTDLTNQISVWDNPSRRTALFRAQAGTAACDGPASRRSATYPLGIALSTRLAPSVLLDRRITAFEITLAALVQVLFHRSAPKNSSENVILIDTMTDGRTGSLRGFDCTGSVGNFSCRFPVVLRLAAFEDSGLLAEAKSALRSLPDSGLGFELLNRDLGSLPASRIALVEATATGPFQPDTSLLYDARIEGEDLIDGHYWLVLQLQRNVYGLRLTCTLQDAYRPVEAGSEELDNPEKIARNVALTIEHLLSVSDEMGAIYTPSDFPLAPLDQISLSKLLQEYEGLEDIYLLSPMQESMLVHSLTNPGSGIGFEQACHKIEGPLNVGEFQRAWQAAIDRHPILRSAFAWKGLLRPLQIVQAKMALIFRIEDWSELSQDKQNDRLASLLEQERHTYFDLGRPPLLRGTIISLGPDAHIFISAYHHILLDGWSLPQLEREVRLTYEALCEGRAPQVWASPPYSTYIAWLQRQDQAEALNYFQSLLSEYLIPARLPERIGAASDGKAGSIVTRATVALTVEEARSVTRFARLEQLTVGVLVHAAWGLVLMQANRSHDVVFGTTVSGRPPELPDVDRMLGLFINNLPVRLSIDEDTKVETMLAALHAQLLETRQHEIASLVEIEQTSPIAGARLFDSLIVIENVPTSLNEWEASPELCFKLLNSPLKTSYGLTLVAIPGDRLQLSLVFNEGRFELATVNALLAETRRLLLDMVLAKDYAAGSLLRHAKSVQLKGDHCPSLPPSWRAEQIVLPRNSLEVQVAQIAEDLLCVEGLGVTQDLIACGMTSISISRFAQRLSESFGQAIPVTLLIGSATIAEVAALLATPGRPALAWQPLITMGKGNPERSFYCVHPIAGDVSVFLDLARAMAPALSFIALQAPGMGCGDPEPESVEDLAALYLDVLAAAARTPIDIGGYSFGGVVAFEIARQLEARGHAVRSVVIIDTPAPSFQTQSFETFSEAQWLWRMIRVRERFHGVDLGLSIRDLERAEDTKCYDLVLSRLCKAELLPKGSDIELLRRMATIGHRHYRLYQNYRPVKIKAPIIIIRAADLPLVETGLDFETYDRATDLGWHDFTSGALLTAATPGDHVTMMRSEGASALAANIEKLLGSLSLQSVSLN